MILLSAASSSELVDVFLEPFVSSKELTAHQLVDVFLEPFVSSEELTAHQEIAVD